MYAYGVHNFFVSFFSFPIKFCRPPVIWDRFPDDSSAPATADFPPKGRLRQWKAFQTFFYLSIVFFALNSTFWQTISPSLIIFFLPLFLFVLPFLPIHFRSFSKDLEFFSTTRPERDDIISPIWSLSPYPPLVAGDGLKDPSSYFV